MNDAISAAQIEIDSDGAAISPRYGDIYASRDGADGQARHVFLGGNGLPSRWADVEQFVIVENGFGLGVNFLTTWQAWRGDLRRARRLHYVAIEQHPVSAAQLRELVPAGLRSLADCVAACWPLPTPGLHRLEFEGGAVVLTLAFGDARRLAPLLACGADALYLDGFAPDRNPQMWEPALLKALAHLARPGATLATWCTARTVRDALTANGFELELRPGYGRKRHMLAGSFAPRWQVRRHEPPQPYRGARSVVVVGSGLAGANVAFALARRGWFVHVFERAGMAAADASSLPWGQLHPQVTADDSVLARLTRAGCVLSGHVLHTLAPGGDCGERPLWRADGVFQVASSDVETELWRSVAPSRAAAQGAVWVDADEARQRIGARPRRGGWWFEAGAIAAPQAWCEQALASPNIVLHCGAAVTGLQKTDAGWTLRVGACAVIEVPVVVVANALGAPLLLGADAAATTAVRGRVTRIDAAILPSLRAALTGDGYVIKGPDGWAGVGATYETPTRGDAGIETQAAEQAQAGNLARLARLLAVAPEARPIGVFDALRCVARDRLPLAGAVADTAAAQRQSAGKGAHLADLPRHAGLFASYAFGSRGLSLAALCGELIAGQIEGEPAPIERDLVDALDPARFMLRALRRGQL